MRLWGMGIMEWWLPIGSLVLTGIVIPMLGYFFKENKRQHEESRSKVEEVKSLVGGQDVILGKHDVRIYSLEQWRLYNEGVAVRVPQVRTDERLSDVHSTYNPKP